MQSCIKVDDGLEPILQPVHDALVDTGLTELSVQTHLKLVD